MGRPKKNTASPITPLINEAPDIRMSTKGIPTLSEELAKLAEPFENPNKMPPMEIMKHRYQDKIVNWRRDEYGFLPIEYKFKENGRVDWAAMIPKEFFVPNKEKFPEGTDLASLEVEKLRDDQLLLLLAGVRYIGLIRGIKSIKKVFSASNQQFSSCVCTVEFIPNFETNGQVFTYDGEGDAHFENTSSFAQRFLTTISGNRAEARAIKLGLDISFLTQEEMGPTKKEIEQQKAKSAGAHNPINTLQKVIKQANFSFGSVKKAFVKNGYITDEFNDVTYTTFPVEHAFDAINFIKNAAKKAQPEN